MKTRFIEVTNGHAANWGKFLVGVFDERELAHRSVIDHRPLVWGRGWGPGHVFVLDLQTGEGATFKMGGIASADLEKHRVWVCPLFEPFLAWLYVQPDPLAIPAHVDLPDAPFAFSGYRRPGPSMLECGRCTKPIPDDTWCSCAEPRTKENPCADS